MHQCPTCHAPGTPLEGAHSVGPNGELLRHHVCNNGHTYGVPVQRGHGPCPSCGHRWVETVRGSDPDRVAAAPATVEASDIHSLAAQLGLGGVQSY